MRKMKTGRIAMLLLVAGAGLASVASAAETDARASRERIAEKLQKRFAQADADGNGLLDRNEAKAGMPFVSRHFNDIDEAGSGTISLEQIEGFVAGQVVARKSGR